MLVDADEDELIVSFSETFQGLSILTGIPRSTLTNALWRGSVIHRGKHRYKVESVRIPEAEWEACSKA